MDYAPNSHRFKDGQSVAPVDETKKVEKVVTGTAKTKSKSGAHKFADIFISADVDNVKSYLVNEMLVPTVKRAILGALDMVLNGGTTDYGRSNSTRPKVSYSSYYDDPRDRDNRPRAQSRLDYDDIVFPNRGDAEAVLREMRAIISRYRIIAVADLYDLAGIAPPYTSNRYGWTNLDNAEVIRVRDGNGYGYIIKLPRAMPID